MMLNSIPSTNTSARSPRLALLFGLALISLCSCGDRDTDEEADGGPGADALGPEASTIVTAPQQFLPGPGNIPPLWKFIGASASDGKTYQADYKRTIEGAEPDYVGIRVELINDVPSAVAHYHKLRTRYRKKDRLEMRTVEGIGSRSVMLISEPKRLLFMRANAVIEIEAERLPESAHLFGRIVDGGLENALATVGVQPGDVEPLPPEPLDTL